MSAPKVNHINWKMPDDEGHVKVRFLIAMERLLELKHSLTRVSKPINPFTRVEDIWLDQDGNAFYMGW